LNSVFNFAPVRRRRAPGIEVAEAVLEADRSFARSFLVALALGLAIFGSPTARAADPPASEEQARRATHLLEYLAADYPGTVSDGQVVNELEYAEQLEFATQIRANLAALGVADGDALALSHARFEAAIRARASGEAVSQQARELAFAVRERFGVRAMPPRTPDFAKGRALYATTCAPCHGATGLGDGPRGKDLDPPPRNFHERDRMLALSPFALFSTITYGLAGTGMLAYDQQLDEASRWDLAYYVGALGFSEAEIARGKALLDGQRDVAIANVPTLASLTHRSIAELGAGNPDTETLLAYLRAHPEALRSGDLPLDVAKSRLAQSLDAFQAGDRERALDLAISSYLDGFEAAEPALNVVDSALRNDVEAEYMRYRAALREGRAPAEVTAIHRSLAGGLAQAEQRLASDSLGPKAVFAGALTILAREGLEAVLLVVAIIGVLVRAGRRDALRFVHAGWITALVAGAATWWIASRIVAMSGASREVVEGVSALTATAILFYVSYWLLSKTESARWQSFLDDRLKTALSRGSLGMLALLTFIAVYRECFETVLFFQALAAQAGPTGTGPLLAGIAGGALLLAVLALTVFRFGQRLPMRRFFAASSLLLYGLAIVLAGHGIAALQEAGWIPATSVSLFRIEWLGIYPTWQGLALQGALVLAALAALPMVVGGFRGEPTRAS
jgi:high-affinity iron transporter